MMKATDKPLALLGGLSIEVFLRDYWQKKPLLVRQAIPHFVDPLSPDEIAGLSCESDIPSRLVLEKHGKTPWELRQGAFDEAAFSQLPETHWSLLVNDVEKYIPEVQALIEPFRFIPDWRFDDLQVSYSAPEGTVGAHWDDYDVFLLQGLGQKNWKVSYQAVSEDSFVPDIALRLMHDFVAEEEWVLEPGDLLYLPPRLAHWGTAMGESVTWSIGFRSPRHVDLVQGFADCLTEMIDTSMRYQDPDLIRQDHPARLSDAAIDQVQHILMDALISDREFVADWLGRYLTEPKLGLEPEVPEEAYTLDDIRDLIAEGVDIERARGGGWLFRETLDDCILSVAGETIALSLDMLPLVQTLCQHTQLRPHHLKPFFKTQEGSDMLLDLFNQGLLVCLEDDQDDDAQ